MPERVSLLPHMVARLNPGHPAESTLPLVG